METELLVQLYNRYLNSHSVSTDSRSVQSGDIFFALKGDNFDGNQYAFKALESGASVAVVDDPEVAVDDRYLLVPDGLRALQDLANYHRKQLSIPVIGLTGSNGKTTTKELIRDVLATRYHVHATEGNFNNHIGVPLTLLQITDDIEIAVIEMGANRVGEIARLCEIAEPDHGMITNIGKAHIGTFGGYENILRGKTELYQHLRAIDGQVWINGSDPVLSNMIKRFDDPQVYLTEDGWYNAEIVESSPFIVYKDERGKEYSTQLIGAYNFANLVAALAIGKTFNVDPDSASEAICNYVPENNRSQIVRKGSNTILMDAYNANPTSMDEALKNLDAMDSGKKVVIVGDMNELGESTESEHDSLCERLAGMSLAESITVGPLIRPAAEKYGLKWFGSASEVVDSLINHPLSDSLILLKASRSIELEKVMEAFES